MSKEQGSSMDRLENVEEASQSESSVLSFDDFELLKNIGGGTYGEVFLARSKRRNNIFAMKLQSKEKMDEKKHRITSVHRELNILKSLNSPFIIEVAAAFHCSIRTYLVTEYVSRGDLFNLTNSYRANNQVFPSDYAKFCLAEILLGIKYLHQKNIAHRDIKRENSLVTSKGHIKLCDFGNAKGGMAKGVLTNTYCGTTACMAPEVVKKEGYSRSADLWSYGIIMLELLIGSNPFERADEKLTKEAIRNFTPDLFHFPSVDEDARDLASNLITLKADRFEVEQIQPHRYFNGFDWKKAENHELEPPISPDFWKAENTQIPSKDEHLILPNWNPVIIKEGQVNPFENFTYLNANAEF